MKAKHLVLLLSAALAYGAFLIAGIRGEARAKERQTEMESMFALVPQFPGATRVQHSASHKISNGIVSSSYATTASFADIRAYYDAELSKYGWSFVSEEQLPERGNAPGRRSAFYMKAPYRAHLTSGSEGYGLSFSW